MEERDLLVQLLNSLSSLNDGSEGYMNSLAVEYNLRLEAMGLPIIEYYNEYNIKVVYNEEEDNLTVTDTMSGDTVLVIEEASSELDPLDLIDDATLMDYVEKNHKEELEAHFS